MPGSELFGKSRQEWVVGAAKTITGHLPPWGRAALVRDGLSNFRHSARKQFREHMGVTFTDDELEFMFNYIALQVNAGNN
jgi:hypothetical protein